MSRDDSVKVRWLVQTNVEPTAKQVKQLQAETGVGAMKAAQLLLNKSAPVLQYMVGREFDGTPIWEDVLTVTEVRDITMVKREHNYL